MPKPPLYAPWRVLWIHPLVLIAALSAPPNVAAQEDIPPCAACLVFVVRPGALPLVSEPLHGLELLVRYEMPDPSASVMPSGQPAVPGVAEAMEVIRSAHGRAGLWIEGAEDVNPDARILEQASRIVVNLVDAVPSGGELAFRLKGRLTELRGEAPEASLGIAAEGRLLDELLTQDIASYVDFLVRPDRLAPSFDPVGLGAGPLGTIHEADGAAAARHAAAVRWVVSLPADVIPAQQILRDAARAAPILREGLIPGGTVSIRCGERRIPTFLDPASLDTIGVSADCEPSRLVVAPAVEGTERVALSGGLVVVRVPSVEGSFSQDVSVVGARTLTVREIIARHQAAAARQRRLVREVISTGNMTLTFEAPGFPAPLAITSEAVIYAAPDRTEIEQRNIRVNGIAFGAGGVPRLPLLEPERVASPPLAITLGELYRYSLSGQEEIDGVRSYVVAFQPVDRAQSLFSGRAWIAVDSFAMVRVSAVQTALRGPIVSSEQVDEFREQAEGAWLLARSDIRQIYEGAGHRTPIHRVLTITRHEVNPEAFDRRREAAYLSPSIMLRDTPEGFRYLRRVRAADGSSGAAVTPVVTGAAQRVRTVILGVIVDPNITRPLPFAGLSYVDFNLFGTGTQVNGFFGGTYGQLAISVPSLAGTRWQLAGRAFGIVSSYNDRAFVEGREIYEANVAQRPAHASMWLLRPVTPRVSVRFGYDFDYTQFGSAGSTAPSFIIPADQVAHAVRAGADGQWAGWTGSLWWTGARRAGWRRWGDEEGSPSPAEGYHPRHRAFQRAGASLARSWVASPRLVGRVEAAWMAGKDLDRFSRYSFGSFDNRLRGYPAALIRYDRGGVLRTSLAWAAGRYLRLDAFADAAYVRDPGFGVASRPYSGLGVAAELPAPFGTLLAVEWGHGFQGLDAQGRRGTNVIRISGYKMF